MKKESITNVETINVAYQKDVSRRKFLSYAGLSAAGMVVLACQDPYLALNKQRPPDNLPNKNPHDKPKERVNLGSGDIGILNYAYALEQLEAAFYIQVLTTPYSGITAKEMEYLTDIRDHEIAHREFFRNVLGARAIGSLGVDFSSIMFSSRDSVLGTAKAFEDLGVSAYNGAGQLIADPNYLLYAGKIVSVEARHAAAIRDLISCGSFADSTVVNAMGLDVVRSPQEVLAIAKTYITTLINAENLPTS